jgi:REP element-mobilizing transposase RayT
MKQTSFCKSSSYSKVFGGELLKNKRKGKRPLSVKKSIHTVLRGEVAKSGSFLKHRQIIHSTITKFADKFAVKIYKEGLARDHLHLILKFKSEQGYKGFVRAVTGVLAKTLKLHWIYRPFTRVIEWGKDFKRACDYVLQNELEGLGLIPYRTRKPQRSLSG